MCTAAGIEPVFTTSADNGGCCAPEDMADLVEYCWGSNGTKWGAQRVADGHPAPYRVTRFELGNEQYNHRFAAQVSAMESRATSLGMGQQLLYLSPNNAHWLDEPDAAAVEGLGLGDRVASDEHVGGGGGVALAATLFASRANLSVGAANAETNARTHHVGRMLTEASDLNDWLAHPIPSTTGDPHGRLKFRTASFCTERSGHFDGFDQGIAFFLPNQTWLQPPGHVHAMIKDHWLPMGVAATLAPPTPPGATALYSASAAASYDASTVVLRYANSGVEAQALAVTIDGEAAPLPTTVVQISDPDLLNANPAGDPDRISPKEIEPRALRAGRSDAALVVPGQSFTVMVWKR